MKAIDKYMEREKVKVIESYCPFGFSWIKRGITQAHPDPEMCNGRACEECWNMEWEEN